MRLRTKWISAVTMAATLTGGSMALLVPPASAVHDLAFQLDGDVLASTTTNVGGSTQTVDWSSLFDASGNPTSLSALPGFTASVFNRDFSTNADGTFNTSDPTTFATGSKDTLPISDWQCNFDHNVNSKIDVMNDYATAYTAPSGDQILYFGLERNDNSGDGNVGFWFLKDKTVGCTTTATTTTATFTGAHQDGDLLIVSAFTNGGSVSTIDVYRWNGGANGSLGTTPVAHGVDCKTTSAGDTACATVNGSTNGTSGTITTPWLTSNKQDGPGHTLRESEFFEGGLDLTKANLGGCYNTFLGDTRSSQSLTATLFDYAGGILGECNSTTTTTPVESDGTTPIPSGGLDLPTNPSTIQVKDQALVNVTGVSSFSGNVSWSLCGPFASSSSNTCSSGGVPISSTDITANGTYTSDAATVTEAGRYCWRADFTSTTSGVPASSDSRSSECFTVNPVQPTLATTAGEGPVVLGNPVTDTATLSGTASEPGSGGPAGGTDGSIDPTTAGGPAQGTITFTLLGPNDCTTVAYTSSAVTVSGDGTYGPVSFTPTAIGTYHWVASYTGDLPNTLSASHNSSCTDTAEDVTVSSVAASMTTAQSFIPNDSATVTASQGGNLAGSVTFKAFQSSDCSGTALYSQTVSVSGASPQTVSTTNTSVSTTAANLSWLVSYSSTNPAQRNIPATCLETSTLTINNGSSVSSP